MKIYAEDANEKRIELQPDKSLEECGYLGGPKTKPQLLQLIYDFVTEFHECPLLMCDNYFT